MNSSAKSVLAAVIGGALFFGNSDSCFAQQRSPEEHLKCDTPGVQLQGVLTARTFYGPPGFGETPAKDAREKALILKLPKPITVDPIDDEKDRSCLARFPHLPAIQLFIFPEAKLAEARKLVGKEVVATGTLREGDAPSEHTKVTLQVKTVEPK